MNKILSFSLLLLLILVLITGCTNEEPPSNNDPTGEGQVDAVTTAPKLTIKSPNARIQNGTFVGDIYVEAKGFNLTGTDVQGSVYFASEEYKDSFTIEDATKIQIINPVEVKVP